MKRLSTAAKAAIRKQRLSHLPNGLAGSLIGMGTGSQPSWWESLDQLSCEVLLLTGELDQKFCMIAEKMSKVIKNAKWDVVKNNGHAIHVEEREKFGTIVSDFLLGCVKGHC
jgi:2-succinyl-6-hydroxy-2,4-cyclohexadiene-1-carboxylate synthase